MDFLTNQAENLAAKVKELISLSGKSNVEISNDINELLIKEAIILPLDKVVEYNNYKFATINPDECEFNIPLDKKHLYAEIKANSFGPFNSEEYFNIPPKKRILWLLKEPLLKRGTWDDGDRGAHDQASEYRKWETIIKNKISTYVNLIKYSRILLEKLGINYIGNDEAEIMEKYMNHICILEVNHFPGLSFKSNESDENYLKKWYEINQSLLKILIDFYDPQIVIGGHTFEFFLDSDFKNIAIDMKNGGLSIFDDLIETWAFPTDNEENIKKGINVQRNINYKGKSRHYVQAYHPCCVRFGQFKPEYAEFDGQKILEWQK